MLTVGIPKEIKSKEKRVGLTPLFATQLTRQGVRVLVEKDAGAQSGFPDAEYKKAGAEVCPDHASIFAKADLIQKVKEPLALEFPLLRKGQILFCFLHLASPANCDLIKALVSSGATAIGFETLVVDGKVPILKPMSEIAGSLAAIYAAYFWSIKELSSPKSLTLAPLRGALFGKKPDVLLRKCVGDQALDSRQPHKGAASPKRAGMTSVPFYYPSDFFETMESLAGHYPDSPKNLRMPKAIIFGGGVAGINATEFAVKMGGEVILIEKDKARLESLKSILSSPSVFVGDQALDSRQQSAGMTAVCLSPNQLSDNMLEAARVLIACVHNPGKRADPVIKPEVLERVSRKVKKIMIDISIDQGGNFPEARPTSYENPLYLDSFGNLRFAVANIPSLSGRGASEALSKAAFLYTEALAKSGRAAFEKFPQLQTAVNVDGGKVLIDSIREAHQLK